MGFGMCSWSIYIADKINCDNDDLKKYFCFISLWMDYNCYYNEKYQNFRNDNEKALKIKDEQKVIEKYEESKNTFLESFRERR